MIVEFYRDLWQESNTVVKTSQEEKKNIISRVICSFVRISVLGEYFGLSFKEFALKGPPHKLFFGGILCILSLFLMPVL